MSATAAPTNAQLLNTDAKNRAWRSFVQGFAMDLVAALFIWVGPMVSDIESWSDWDTSLIGLLFLKTLILTGFSYVMRRYIDGSSIPTPLPPEPAAEPAADVE